MKKQKHTGYQAPKDYFKSLDSKIIEAIDQDNFLQELKMDASGHKVPDQYFEQFEDKLFDSLNKEKSGKIVSLFNYSTIRYISGIAAMLIVGLFFFKSFDKTEPLTIEDVDVETMAEYVDNHYLDIDSYELANYIESEDIDNIKTVNINDEELLEYLELGSDINDLL